jgi:hypothetical protein
MGILVISLPILPEFPPYGAGISTLFFNPCPTKIQKDDK